MSNALARAAGEEDVEQENDEDDDDDSDDVFSDRSRNDDTASDISTSDASNLADKKPTPGSLPAHVLTNSLFAADVATREAEAERLVAVHTAEWKSSALEAAAKRTSSTRTSSGATVVVTGASGSLGSHLLHSLAERPDVTTVMCINRPVSNVSADKRQADALSSRNLELSPAARAKLRVYDTDTSKPQLGLPAQEYAYLAQHGTHIIHNAWPMSVTRPLKAFEPQVKVMRNLLDLAREMAIIAVPRRIGFQFVSSIAVVGFSAEPHVLEQPMPMAAVLPSGYNEGKWVCERMLTETLHRHPRLFRAAVVRPGQISGSTTTGFWNPVEHSAFMVKSAQALQAWPDLQGQLHWLPVDRTAAVMIDLLKLDSHDDDAPADVEVETETYPVYHVDNPIGQPWKEISAILTTALHIPENNIIPFRDWIARVRQSPLPETDNPAVRLVGFLEKYFERMACGGIVLDTRRAEERSRTLAVQGPVSEEVVRSYVRRWKEGGFLVA